MQEKIRIYYITVSKNIYLGEIMRYKRFYEFIFISVITICFFLGDSQAGEIQDISFDDHSIIYIKHKNCTLEKTIQGSQKLIIPLKNCKVSTGNIETLNNDLKRIYWMQYDSNTVWVIVAFADSYESDKFEIETHIDKFKICLPFCQTYIRQPIAIIDTQPIMFYRNGIPFIIPLENMTIEQFIDQSIGFTPKDMIRDGLPFFGSKRGDWEGKQRKHLGYDIYADKTNVLAAAQGTVLTVSKGSRAGLYIKLRHPQDIDTVYVHLAQSFVKEGQQVNSGTIIGRIDGPSGNAVSPQLHFEIQSKGKCFDPLEFIESHYKENTTIIEKIEKYKERTQLLIIKRDQLVQEFLKNQR